MSAPADVTPQSSAPVDDAGRASIIRRQAREVCALKEQFFAGQAGRIVACCQVMARRFDAGGRMLSMGNGGSIGGRKT